MAYCYIACEQKENAYENQRKPLVCQDQIISYYPSVMHHCHVHISDNYSSRSMDYTLLCDSSDACTITMPLVRQTQEKFQSDIILSFQFFGNQLQFLIPFFTELPDEGLFQELINGKILFLA